MTAFALATGLAPDAVVHSTAKPHTDEWFDARRQGITATDLPKILGLSEYGNATSVWMDKQGRWFDEAREAAEWGTELEPVIARVWGRRNNTGTVPVEMLANRGRRWMIANLDRIVARCPLGDVDHEYGCALEVKTRSAWVAGQWRDDMPDDVLAQVGWQRKVSGFPHIHVACLIGGQRLIGYTYHRDDSVEEFLVAEGQRVWANVQDGSQPLDDPNTLLVRVLNVLYADRDGVTQLDLDTTVAVIDRYETARLAKNDAAEWMSKARAELVVALGEHEAATVDLGDGPRVAYTYKPNSNGVRTLRIDPLFRKDAET